MPKFFLNLKLCMNIFHFIMYPFIFLFDFFMHFFIDFESWE
jgi:hypothetical protein